MLKRERVAMADKEMLRDIRSNTVINEKSKKEDKQCKKIIQKIIDMWHLPCSTVAQGIAFVFQTCSYLVFHTPAKRHLSPGFFPPKDWLC